MDVVTGTRKARKTHACEVCYHRIQPGEMYRRTITFDGEVFNWKNCLPCDDPISQAMDDGYDDCGTISADSVRKWAHEHMGLYDAANALNHRLREHHAND